MVLRIEGQRFGRLLAVRALGSIKKKIIWQFICDCGSEPELPATFVVRGHTSSCGCLRIEASRESVLRDVTGQRFGRLMVLGRSGGSVGGRVGWRCKCDCGREVIRPSKNLTNGTAVSCGCRKIEAREEYIAAKAVDPTGLRFGKLVVLGDCEPTESGARRIICACDCGGLKKVRYTDVQSGKTISCGCAARDPVTYMSAEARHRGAIGSAKRRARLAGAGGTFTYEQVAELYKKQRGCCAWCPKKLRDVFHRDHKEALALGGSNWIENIELLCPKCNSRKNAMDQIAWANLNGKLC